MTPEEFSEYYKFFHIAKKILRSFIKNASYDRVILVEVEKDEIEPLIDDWLDENLYAYYKGQ